MNDHKELVEEKSQEPSLTEEEKQTENPNPPQEEIQQEHHQDISFTTNNIQSEDRSIRSQILNRCMLRVIIIDRLDEHLRKTDKQDPSDIFFSMAFQRKEESLRLLKDWAIHNTKIFEQNREILEEMIGGIDLRSRLSVDFMTICFRFFGERCSQEARYAKLLLTKPGPKMLNNFAATNLYGNTVNQINQFDEQNIKQQALVAAFASKIETDILNGKYFEQFSIIDQLIDKSISALIIQRKLLQQHLIKASSRLNKMIPLFNKSKSNPQQEAQKQPSKGLLTSIGQIFVGPNTFFQDKPSTQKQQKTYYDLYKIMQGFLKINEQVMKTFNICLEKFVEYWGHIIHLEQIRSEWIHNSCKLYYEMYKETYRTECPNIFVEQQPQDIEQFYSVAQVLPKDLYQNLVYPNLNRDNFFETLKLHSEICGASKMLIVKEFNVIRVLNNQLGLSAILVLSIDQFLGCWDRLDNQQIENSDKPAFHYHNSQYKFEIVSAIEVEIIPTTHLLMVNVGHSKSKTVIRFQCQDDLEEFVMILESHKG